MFSSTPSNADLGKRRKIISLLKPRLKNDPGDYQILNAGKWKNYVTTDEAMFYLGASYWQRRVCYIRQGQPLEYITKYVKRDDFAPGFMVLAGVSARGKTSPCVYRQEGEVELGFLYSKSSEAFCQKICAAFVSRGVKRDHGVPPRQRIFPYIKTDAAVTRDRRCSDFKLPPNYYLPGNLKSI